MGNQSPHRCFTVSMSSWQRRRRLTSLSALDGTASVIHTCGGGASGGRGVRGRGVRRAAHPAEPPPQAICKAGGMGRLTAAPRVEASPLLSVPAPGITDTPPCREGLGGWGYPEAPSLLTGDAPEPRGGQLASVLSCFSPTELHTECPHPPCFPSPAVPPLGGHTAPPLCLGQWYPMTQSSMAPGLGWGGPGTCWI